MEVINNFKALILPGLLNKFKKNTGIHLDIDPNESSIIYYEDFLKYYNISAYFNELLLDIFSYLGPTDNVKSGYAEYEFMRVGEDPPDIEERRSFDCDYRYSFQTEIVRN